MAAKNRIEIVIGATDKASNVLGGVGKALGGIGKIAAGAGIAVAGATAGIGVALGSLAMKAAPLEGIGMAFEKMSDRVGLSLDELRKASAGTVSDFELMRKANLALTGAGDDLGREFGKNLPKLLEAARAAAKATGQDVDFLFESLVTGVKRGSPMLIDNTGLVVKLGEANEAMAAQLGKTVEEMTAEEKSIALLNATLKAGERMVSEFGGGALTAAEKLAQFRAKAQNTKDQIGLALLPALEAVLDSVSKLTGESGPMITEWAKKLGLWLAEAIPIAINKVIWVIGILKDAFVRYWPMIVDIAKVAIRVITEWLGFLGSAIDRIIAIAQGFAGEFMRGFEAAGGGLPGIMSGIMEILDDYLSEDIIGIIWKFHDTVIDIFGTIRDIITGIDWSAPGDFPWEDFLPPWAADVAYTLSDAFEVVRDAVIAFSGSIQEGEGTVAALKEALIALGLEDVITSIENIIGKFTEFKSSAEENFGSIRDTVAPIFESIISWIEEKLPIAQATFLTFWEIIKATAEAVAEAFKTNVLPPLQEAFASLTEAIGKLGLDWSDVWDAIWGAIKIVVYAIVAIIIVLIGVITSIIAAIANVAAHVANVLSDMVDTFMKGLEAISKIVGGAMAIVKGIFTGDTKLIWEGIKAFASGIVELIVAMGEGFINTIRLTFGTIITAVLEFVNTFINFIKDFVNELVGNSIIQDMMDDMLDIIRTVIGNILGVITGFIADAIAAFSGMATDLYNIGVNIMESLQEGITSVVGGIISGIEDTISDIISSAEDMLGMSSPSRVFMGIGRNMMEGMAAGIWSAGGLPMGAAAGVAGGVARTTNNYFNLTVHSRAETSPVIESFEMMKAIA